MHRPKKSGGRLLLCRGCRLNIVDLIGTLTPWPPSSADGEHPTQQQLHREAKAHARGVFCRSGDVGGGAELRTARRIEAEANRFAATLLMPASLVEREAVEWKFNVHVLARRFDVSLPAMQLRLTTLDLLPAYMR